jgi:hypothetical protein
MKSLLLVTASVATILGLYVGTYIFFVRRDMPLIFETTSGYMIRYEDPLSLNVKDAKRLIRLFFYPVHRLDVTVFRKSYWTPDLSTEK